MIHLKLEENIAVISFDSPKGNLLSYHDLELFEKILLSKEVDSAYGIILRGENRSFCTGVNIDNNIASSFETFKKLDEVLLILYSYKRPLIAVLSGHSIGAGFLFLLCADYVYAPNQTKIKFGLPEINIGLGLDDLMLYLLNITFTPLQIKALLYTGDYVDCRILYDIKLINSYIESQDLRTCGLNIIKSIIDNKLSAFLYCKKAIRKNNIANMETLLETECYAELSYLYEEKDI